MTGTRVTTYDAYLRALEQRMSGKRARPRTVVPTPRHPKQIAGLFELLASFASGAPFVNGGVGPRPEWNPFAQRLLCQLRLEDKRTQNEADFVAATVDRLLLLAHEATHVLLWEPFFAGHFKRTPTEEEFADASVCFEGFCFWYADILVTRALRERLPDGEFVRARSAASQALFHPYRAFEALGIRDERRILDVYLNAFRGNVSPLSTNRKMWLVQDLFVRFTQMYAAGLDASRAQRRQLDLIGAFGEFRARFAGDPRLPSILPARLLRMDLAADPAAYCFAVARYAYAHLATLSPEQLRAVRLRRALQTRAYHAYSVQHACTSGALMNRRGKSLAHVAHRALPSIASYLDRLSLLIDGLAEGTSCTTLERALMKADSFYEQEIRAYFLAMDAWLSRRHILYPGIGTEENVLGLQQPSTHMSPADMRTISNRLLEEALPKALPTGTPESKRISRKASALLAVASSNLASSRKPWRSCVNALLLDPLLLPSWSVELAAVSPAQNQFREVLFSFA